MDISHTEPTASNEGTRRALRPQSQGRQTLGPCRASNRYMARYRLKAVAELCDELKRSPKRLRAKQLDGLEHLLGSIQPRQRYACSFIRDSVFGVHPHETNGHGTLAGQRLIGDLVRLVEDLSSEPIGEAASWPEKVWTREQLAQRMNVSMTTVSRWRRRGLGGPRGFR